MTKTLHPVAGILALGLIALFWIATVVSEAFAPLPVVVAVKTAIPWAFLVLIPALVLAGASGAWLSRTAPSPLALSKRRRMPIVAANGLLVLVPAALFLAIKAASGAFDTAFYVVQGVELVAGAVNIGLLGLNLRDGMRMTGRVGRVVP